MTPSEASKISEHLKNDLHDLSQVLQSGLGTQLSEMHGTVLSTRHSCFSDGNDSRFCSVLFPGEQRIYLPIQDKHFMIYQGETLDNCHTFLLLLVEIGCLMYQSAVIEQRSGWRPASPLEIRSLHVTP